MRITQKVIYNGKEKKMKVSKYNSLFEIDGLTLGYNSLTNALVELDKKEAARFKSLLNGSLSPDLLEKEEGWIRGGFIHDDSIDELDQIKLRLYKSRYSNNMLGLTIAPTLSCNFRCIYCYEKSSELEAEMSQEVQDRIIAFISAQANHIDTLAISWYGGEPLLAMNTIRALTERFRIICSEHNILYSAGMVTNGYLLNTEIAQELKALSIEHIQVTLDGLRKIHDTRRPLLGGHGTYNKIIENVIQSSKIIPISLRVNLDKKNINYNMDFFNELEKMGIKDRVYVYPGWVLDANSCYDCSSCLSLPEYSEERLIMARELAKRGFNMGGLFEYPRPLANICCADSIGGYVIAPNGDMYSCWGDIGITQHRIGSLLNSISNHSLRRNAFLLYDPTLDEECRDCRYLPICMGGCPKRRLEKDAERCTHFKYGLEKYLSFTAERILNERNQKQKITDL